VLKALKYTFKRPYYIGMAYFYGYIKSFILRKERVNDGKIKYYYEYIRTEELKNYYKRRLKKLLKGK